MVERIRTASGKSDSKRENSVSHVRKAGLSKSVSSPINHILYLQRTIGNQAVQRLLKQSGVGIQAKLRIGRPNDIYEQEADRVADEVTRMPEPAIQQKPT